MPVEAPPVRTLHPVLAAVLFLVTPSAPIACAPVRRYGPGGLAIAAGLLLAISCLGAIAGDPDPTFSQNAGVNNEVFALAVQPDGKVLVGGGFTSVGGRSRNHIARLNADGKLDDGFDPNANAEVLSVAVQADGRILIAGDFTTVAGKARNHIARLNADGTLDQAFDPNASAEVIGMALEPDGKILLGGAFTTVNGATRNHIARLQADGTLDAGFNADVNDSVINVAVQADGKLLLGGAFTRVNGATRNHVARVDANGRLDTGFDPDADDAVFSLALQADGKILLGGRFIFVDRMRRENLARVNADGTVDTDFRNTSADHYVLSLAVQADGKILLGGHFAAVGGTMRNHLARLEADGAVDSGFAPDVNDSVFGLALQVDGKILLGGAFTSAGNSHVARVENTASTQTLAAMSVTSVAWRRGGAAPEISAAAFEVSTDDRATWRGLGAGTRVPGGWRIGGLALPAAGWLRARGRTAGGGFDGSSGMVEQVQAYAGPAPAAPIVIAPTSSDVTTAGATLGGEVTFDGNSPIIERGVVFAPTTVNADPRIGGTGVTKVSAAGATGMFTTVATGLAEGTGYSYAVYATNGIGTSYTTVATFATKPASNNARLSALTLSAGSLAPVFSSSVTSYGASVASGTASVRVAPTLVDPRASVTVNGSAVASGQSSGAIPLVEGTNAITVLVTARDGATTKSYTIALTRATVLPGAVDTDFHVSANDVVYSMAVQGDDKIVIGGRFTRVGGLPRNRIARLNADSTVDVGFDPDVSGQVVGLAVQPDGMILVGSGAMTVGGVARNGIARLYPDGTVDSAFSPNVTGAVNCVAVQADRRILLGGTLTKVGGISRSCIARLEANGALDASFTPDVAGDSGPVIRGLAVQRDGKILLWGTFDRVGGLSRNNIARLEADGTLDAGFNPNANSGVYGLAMQPDGKILLGGLFTSLGGTPRKHVARLNADGTLDNAFDPETNGDIICVALQADGKILLGGGFTTVGGRSRDGIARIGADGVVDSGFVSNANKVVVLYSMAVQADGSVLLGANTSTNGVASRDFLLRLTNDPAGQTLRTTTAARAEWLRSGSAPEVSQVTLELSTGGDNWKKIGRGTRITGGWEINGLTLSGGGLLRVSGSTTGGYANGSSGLVQEILAFSTPGLAPPATIRVAIMTATVAGDVIYDGHSMVTQRGIVYAISAVNSAPRIGGAGVMQLPVSGTQGVFVADLNALAPGTAYSYAVYATNVFGTTYTSVQNFVTQPAGAAASLGGDVQLVAATVAGAPLSYRWSRDGVFLPEARGASLVLNAVQPKDAGLYAVEVFVDGAPGGNSVMMLGCVVQGKVAGEADEVGADIVHPNGNVFDQVLLTGVAEAITADSGQVTRTSFVDLDDDIVQVEFSGPGTLSLVLDGASDPAVAVNYNQPDVKYVKGHAGIVIAGATEATNVSVFSVGKTTAVNPALFKEGVKYDGIADIAFIAILSANGKFGGVRTANANYFASRGYTGIYAPGVQFAGPVYVGNVEAFGTATPVLRLGAASDVRITGGDLEQANGAAVQVSGIAQLRFTAGGDSHGNEIAAQKNKAVLVEDGVDVTAQIVANP